MHVHTHFRKDKRTTSMFINIIITVIFVFTSGRNRTSQYFCQVIWHKGSMLRKIIIKKTVEKIASLPLSRPQHDIFCFSLLLFFFSDSMHSQISHRYMYSQTLTMLQKRLKNERKHCYTHVATRLCKREALRL